jgi:hypothetical protein
MSLTTNIVQTPVNHAESENGKEQNVIIDKLTSAIPSPGFITDPFKGSMPTTSTPFTRK